MLFQFASPVHFPGLHFVILLQFLALIVSSSLRCQKQNQEELRTSVFSTFYTENKVNIIYCVNNEVIVTDLALSYVAFWYMGSGAILISSAHLLTF